MASRFEGNPDYQIFSGPSFVTNMFNYNYNNDVWSDKRVRQAFMYGIDRASIISVVFNGTAQATPCQDPYPTFWPEDANYYEYNPEKARQLLDEAAADGVTLDGINLDIPTYYTSQLAKDILTVMQANMADIGVNVNPLFLDVPTWRTVWTITRRNGTWPIAVPAQVLHRTVLPGTLKATSGALAIPPTSTCLPLWTRRRPPKDYRVARTALCSYQNEEATFAYWWVSTRYGIASVDVEDFHYFPAPGGGPFVDRSQNWNMK